ncbi:MAG TPA: hypothetical protein VGM82_00480 [Gemmatimonadaceae bacterium]|jgi:adhesin/invasin
MSFLSRRTTPFVVPILIALLASTCAEGPTGNRQLAPQRSNLSISTSFSPSAKAAAALIHAAGLNVDRVQVLISRSSSQTLRDTTIALVEGQDQTLDLDVPVDPGTALTATVNYYAGTVLLYSGSGAVTAYAPNTPTEQIPKATIIVVAVAPGSTATRVTVAGPAPSPVTAPVTLTAHAFVGDGEIAGAIFGWSVDDPTIATISATGVLTPTAKSGTVQVTAITLSGVSGTTAVTFYGPAASISTVSGDAQTAEVGVALAAPFVVQVKSATGAPVPNQTVTFGAANGSSVAPTTATTDANGRAQTIPTLGTTPVSFGFTATTSGFSTSITATATTGAPATITVVSGDAQSDTIQKTLKNPLIVKVVDRFGNASVGTKVSWARTAGTGAVSAASTTTDATGQTSITYTLGATAGAESVAASVTGVTAASTFSATALPKPASIALLSGGNQTGVAGKALATQIALKVLDTQGNPSPNVTVTFQTSNGGSVAPVSIATDATGIAKTTWTLGTVVGAQTMTAAAPGLTGSPVTVSATATAAPATALQFGQQPSAVATGAVITPAVTVRAVDADGNTLTAFTGNVTIAIGTNPGSGVPGGTLTRAAVAGVATFNDLTVSTAGAGYTLVASSTGLAAATSAVFNVTTAPNARIEWVNATGGNWSVASNWNRNRVPTTSDSVVIAAPGTYTVTLDTTFVASVIVVGGGTGQQTLTVPSRTLTINTALAVKSTGVLRLSNATVAGAGPLTNEGTVLIPIAAVISDPLVTLPGSILRVASEGATSAASVNVSSGFTNHGTVDLSSTIGGYQSGLLVAGTILNATDGIISSSAGTGGVRVIDGGLDNRGRIDVTNPLALTNAGFPAAVHSNTGTINVSGGDFTVTQSGSAQTFTNDGTVNVPSGRTFAVVNGTFIENAAATLTGAGTARLSTATGTINGDITLGALTLQQTVATFQRPVSTATMAISLDGSTIAGSTTLTNVTSLSLRNSTIATAFDNRGTLLAIDGSQITGAVTTAAGTTIRVYSDGATGTAQLAVSSSFTNNGTIELTSTVGGYESVLNFATATLTNSPTGSINAVPGAGGERTLAGQLVNQGTINVQTTRLKIGGTNAAQVNSGSINLTGGDILFTQSAGTGTFTNNNGATIAINTGRTFSIANGTTTIQASSTLGGAGSVIFDNGTVNFLAPVVIGTLALTDHVVANLASDLTTQTTNVSLDNATINGPGRIVNPLGKSMVMRFSTIAATSAIVNQGTLLANDNNTVNGPLTQSGTFTIQSTGSSEPSTLTMTNGFTNNGTLNLSSTVGGYGTLLTIATGDLTNGPNGILNAAAGSGGARTINAGFVNQGTVNLDAVLRVTKAGIAASNSGLITASGGDFSVDYAAGTGSFANTGGINIAAGHAMNLSGGTFNQQGSFTGAGTLSLSNVTGSFGNSNLPGALTVVGATQTFAGAQLTSATTAFDFSTTTINANNGLTIPSGKSVNMRASTFNSTAALANAGTINFIANNTISAPFTTTNTSQLNVYTDGLGTGGGNSNLTVASSFTNNGRIDMSTVNGGYPGALAVTNGTLTNASGATISMSVGAGGTREIDAALINQGLITVDAPLTLAKAGAAHQNTGTISLGQGDFTIVQSGTTPTFTNTGAIALPPGRTLTVNGGTFVLPSGGSLAGGGALVGTSVNMNLLTTFTVGSLTLRAGSTGLLGTSITTANGMSVVLDNSILNGSAGLTNTSTTGSGTVTMRNTSQIGITSFTNGGTLNAIGTNTISSASFSTTPSSVIHVYADGQGPGGGIGQLTLPGITNNGIIDLSNANGGYDAVLVVSSGTLTNGSGASITTLTGLGGARTINGSVSNNGSITVATGTTNGLSVTGAFTSGPNGQIFLSLASPTNYSQLHTNTVSGTSTFQGPINVSYANGFTATAGQAFQILSYGVSPVMSATFNLPGGTGWTQANGGTTYTITKQ